MQPKKKKKKKEGGGGGGKKTSDQAGVCTQRSEDKDWRYQKKNVALTRKICPTLCIICKTFAFYLLDSMRTGEVTAKLVEHPTEKPRCNTDRGSSPWYGKGFFSLGQLPVQTVLRRPYSLRVQLHALTS